MKLYNFWMIIVNKFNNKKKNLRKRKKVKKSHTYNEP